MADRIIASAGDWAVSTDDHQWILQRRRLGSQKGWRPLAFVHSSRDILARCMKEKGVDVDTAAQLLAGLPHTFNEWKLYQSIEAVG